MPDNLRTALRRLAKLAFGVVQLLLIGRIGLLLFAPSLSDPTVNGFLQLTQPLVAPFLGLSQGELVDQFSGSILDIYAIIAFVGYSILEMAILWILGWELRREPMPPPLPKVGPDDDGLSSR